MAIATTRWHGHVHYIDWLKVLAVLGVFLFHVAMVFSVTGWLINDRHRSLLLSALAGFLFLFGVPLLFLLAGAASCFGLASRTPAQFLKERTYRLMVPLLAGFALLSPLQAFLIQLAAGHPPSSPGFVLDFFRHIRFVWTPRWLGTYGYHLWFLGYLYVFSVLALPLFAAARRRLGARPLDALAAVAVRPGGLLMFVVPVAAAQVLLRPRWPGYQDWSDFATFFCFFAIGWILFTDPRFHRAIRDQAGVALATGVACSLVIGLLAIPGWTQAWEVHPDTSAGSLMYQGLRSLDAWSWLVFVLFLGQRAFDRPNRLFAYGSEGLLPFYVLHHPVVLAVAVVAIRLDIGVWPKFALIALAAFAITVAIYELVIRRSDPLRFFFGLKPGREEAAAQDEPSIATAATG